MSKGISTFEVVAREHLRKLQEAGEPPEQIAMQLCAVATSYDSDGLADEARVLRELVARYCSSWSGSRDGARGLA